MGASYFVIAILRCANGGGLHPGGDFADPLCDRAACSGATVGALEANSQFDFPAASGALPDRQPHCRRGCRAFARLQRFPPVAVEAPMSDLIEPMVHQDAEPGHESTLEPKPKWQPRYQGPAGSRAKWR